MVFGRGNTMAKEPVVEIDPSGWILDNAFAEFVLMSRLELLYMGMFGYTFLHGKLLLHFLKHNHSLIDL